MSAEQQPNISRREVLKRIARRSFLVGGTALAAAGGIDLYSVYKENKESPYASTVYENTPRELRDIWGGLVGAVTATIAGFAIRDEPK
jgi:hypothetical protein